MGTSALAQRVLLAQRWRDCRVLVSSTHHRCLGSGSALPYSAHRGKKSVNREALDELKEQIPLMGYLHAQDWRPARPLSRGRWMGLCPLHGDRRPSFLVDANKDLFYCYGCGRGGDVIRFAELYHQVKFTQAVALLRQWRGVGPVLQEAARFYHTQLHRHSEAYAYLYQRGIRSAALIEEMRIGYAPGGCLRGWLTQLGHSLPAICQAGLVTDAGYDAYVRRIVFPLEGNLYAAAFRIRRQLTAFCRALKAVCTYGSKSNPIWKSSWSKGCSTMPRCGRLDFKTSPARWEPISIRASFANCAMVPGPSIWPLTPT